MEKTMWRKGAKVVAWIHMFLVVLDLAFMVVMATLVTYNKGNVETYVADYLTDHHLSGNSTVSANNQSIIEQENTNLVWNNGSIISNSSSGNFYLERHISEIKNWLGLKDFNLTDQVSENSTEVFFIMLIIWVRIGIMAICTVIELWAAVKLLSAATIDHTRKVTLRNCRIYIVVTVIMALLSIGNELLEKDYISAGVVAVVHLIFLFVVSQFMREI